MSTLVCFHAHPDDEAIATGGTMALAAREGHRVVLVLGTRGELGEPVPGVLGDGEPLWERRVVETHRAAEILGAERVEFLGYEDSGMMGEDTNGDGACFWQADVEEAAGRLAAILRDVDADVLTIYDDHGGYGHPDHIQVHRVGVRAAEMVGLDAVFQSTMNRDQMRRNMTESPEFRALLEEGTEDADTAAAPLNDEERERLERVENDDFGSPEALITHAVDVSAVLPTKLEAMKAHASQIAPDSFFLALADDVFRLFFGTEWFIQLGVERPPAAPFAPTILPA